MDELLVSMILAELELEKSGDEEMINLIFGWHDAIDKYANEKKDEWVGIKKS